MILYDLAVGAYFRAIRLAALWNGKAAAAVAGRKTVFSYLEKHIQPGGQIIWIHAASAGELEQARPLMEKLKSEYSNHRVLLTLFSPSGMHTAQNLECADLVCYLPFDTRGNAKKFMQLANPRLAIFVKYEFWYHHLQAAAFRHIPILLVSAHFRSSQVFFKSYGSFYRNLLHFYRHIFVQRQTDRELLANHGIDQVSVAGDTRFDRVKDLPAIPFKNPVLDAFCEGSKVIVAGSTWPGDEALLAAVLPQSPYKLVIVPHEVDEKHIRQLQKIFPGSVLFSKLYRQEDTSSKPLLWKEADEEEKRYLEQMAASAWVLIIDTTGMLSRVYRYGHIAWVGGGFTKDGIHNILEAAVYGIPVLMGPNFKKYPEAADLVANGGAFSVRDAASLSGMLTAFHRQEDHRRKAGEAAGSYIRQQVGATKIIVDYIQANRLLTS